MAADLAATAREAAAASYVGRRSRASSDAVSVADLRERMAIESLRQTDPSAAPVVAGALAAARLAPTPVVPFAAGSSFVTAPPAELFAPVPRSAPRRAAGQPIVAPRSRAAGRVLGQPVVALVKPVPTPRPSAAPRPIATQPVAIPVVAATPAPVVLAAAVATPVEIAKPIAAPVAAVTPIEIATPVVLAKPIELAEPVDAPVEIAALDTDTDTVAAARGVSITTSGPDSDTGPSTRSGRHSAPAGRRRASRSSGPSIFRIPAGSPTPGSRVAAVRRRATAASRRRPLLLSTPVIVAAIVVGGSIGGERLTSASADTATTTQNADGTTSLGQSDLRVSRQKREATAAAEPTPSPTDITTTDAGTTPATTEPLGGAASPAEATVAEGGAPAATPTATETVAPPPPAATWVKPVEGGSVTSCFCTRWGVFHDGIDIDPPLGTPIVSVGDGTVVFAGPVSGYGIGIYIEHIDGSVSFYGHMAIYYVRTGDVVTAGEEIALVGNEGYSTGPHLHFSVFTSWNPNGLRQNAIDPIPWLAARGVTLGDYNPNG